MSRSLLGPEGAEFRFRSGVFFLLSQPGYNRFFLRNLRRPIKLVLSSPTRLIGSGKVEMLRGITCVGADISAADAKHMIWKLHHTGVIYIFSYAYCFCACEQDGTLIRF